MADPVPTIVVEFYGMPRRRAGRAELTIRARTVKEALQTVIESCPKLSELYLGERLDSHFLLSVDGERFVTDLNEALSAGTRLLLLGADAGG